jgi:YVTN family beta-propeller protein
VVTGTTVGTVTNFNMSGGTTTGQATLGQGPVSALLVGSRTYVINQTDSTLSFFSAFSPQSPPPGTVTLDPSALPGVLAASPDGTALFVAYDATSGAFANTVAVVSTATNTIAARIPLNVNSFTGVTPVAMITDIGGTKLVVANQGTNNISLISASAQAVVATVGGGACVSPSAVARTPDASLVYVACSGSNNVLVVNTSTNNVDFNIPVGSSPNSLAFDTKLKRLIVTNGGGTVSFLDEDFTKPAAQQHAVTTVSIGATPLQAAPLPDGTAVYVATTSGTVVVIDSPTWTVKTGIVTGGAGVQIAPSSDSLTVAVTTASNQMKVIDVGSGTVVGTLGLLGPPRALIVF